MKSVVVTGVSSGIGRGTAKVLVEKGFHVFGSVRKAEDAKQLSDELGNAFAMLLSHVVSPTGLFLCCFPNDVWTHLQRIALDYSVNSQSRGAKCQCSNQAMSNESDELACQLPSTCQFGPFTRMKHCVTLPIRIRGQ